MAATTNRVVELQIKLQGVQSIKELEEVTSEINQELKGIATTSKEFTAMGDLAKKANSKVKEVGTSLEGITSTEKAEAVNKMGMGLVGAFQAAAGASLLFGEKTGEAMQKAQAKVVALFGVTDGLKKLTEAFSAKNIAGLKATVKGWQESAVAAKLFGTTTKAALTATGIGALVVLLGIIIANFDKIKEGAKKVWDNLKQWYPPIMAIGKIVDELKEKFGSLGALIKGIGAFITSVFRGENFEEAKAAMDAMVEKTNKLKEATEKYNKSFGEDGNDAHEKRIALLNEEGDKQQEILDVEKERYTEKVKQLEEIQKLDKEAFEKDKDKVQALKDANFQLEILGIKQTNLNKKKAEELRAAKEKAAAEKKTAEDKAKSDAKALKDEEEALRLRRIAASLDSATAEQRIAINNALESKLEKDKKIAEINADLASSTNEELDNKREANLLSLESLALDKDKIGIIAIALKDNEAMLALQNELFAVTNDLLLTDAERENRIAAITNAQEEYTAKIQEQSKLLLGNLNSREIAELNILNVKKSQIELDNSIAENVLQIQKAALDSFNDNYQARLTELETLSQQRDLEIQEEEELNSLLTTKLELIRNEAEAAADVSLTNAEALKIQNEINTAISKNVVAKVGMSKIEMTALQKYSEAIDKFFAKYGELVGGIRDLTSAAFDLAIQQAEQKAEIEKQKIDETKEATIEAAEDLAERQTEIEEKKLEDAKELQEDYADSLNELNDMLADAEGERYDDIVAQIEEEEALKAQAAQDEIDAKEAIAKVEDDLRIAKETAEKTAADAKAKADERANKLKKTQAIIEATINTALAVLSALKSGFPLGLIMAAVYAALGAVQIATIKKQQFAEGGYTGDGSKHQPAGIVHAGEYVVPQRVVRNPQASSMLETLESMRLKGYADGGSVTVPNVPSTDNMIDYKRIGTEVALALKENPLFVSWVEWRDTDAKARWTYNRASIGKK